LPLNQVDVVIEGGYGFGFELFGRGNARDRKDRQDK